MLYQVIHWGPSKTDRVYDRVQSQVVGTKKAAKALAESWLPPVYETLYSSRVTRLPYVQVYEVSGTERDREGRRIRGKSIAVYDTPIRLVPSVGELGYTP